MMNIELPPPSLPRRRSPRDDALVGGVEVSVVAQHPRRGAAPGFVQGLQQGAAGTPAKPPCKFQKRLLKT